MLHLCTPNPKRNERLLLLIIDVTLKNSLVLHFYHKCDGFIERSILVRDPWCYTFYHEIA
jgi:hypothetical protein